MNRIASTFERLRRQSRGGLMPFLTGGFPDLATTRLALPAMVQAGADIVEIGIPFSDPIADGPVIAESMNRALQAGVTPDGVLGAIASVRPSVDAGMLAMVSISIVDRIGAAAFVASCAAAGVDGLIVPDLDLDEAATLRHQCDDAGLTCTLLVAPNSTTERISRIASLSTGFVYVLARVGLTGESGRIPEDLADRIATVRSVTDLPVAVGFGISSAEQVATVLASADAAIVGSAIVRRMEAAAETGDARTVATAAAETVAALREGVEAAAAR
ncbi:MAG: tryptophan synthase subunit alpha [Phycisphaerales bacterium]|nr:tryptophan synthase subunit alpha [Phycisphaerales bacterium]